MIDKKIYDLDYIRELQARYKTDPGLLERVLYAFGLLEALVKVGMASLPTGRWNGGSRPFRQTARMQRSKSFMVCPMASGLAQAPLRKAGSTAPWSSGNAIWKTSKEGFEGYDETDSGKRSPGQSCPEICRTE